MSLPSLFKLSFDFVIILLSQMYPKVCKLTFSIIFYHFGQLFFAYDFFAYLYLVLPRSLED